LAGSFFPTCWDDYSIIYPIYVTLCNVSYSTASAICCLVVILIFWAVDLFKMLKKKMNRLIELNDHNLLNDIQLLSEWKRQHSVVISLVDHINSCFASTISFIFFHGLCSMISYTYMAAFSARDQTPYGLFYSITSFFTQFFQLYMVIYAGHLLQHEVF